jgi:hypothetical protein
MEGICPNDAAIYLFNRRAHTLARLIYVSPEKIVLQGTVMPKYLHLQIAATGAPMPMSLLLHMFAEIEFNNKVLIGSLSDFKHHFFRAWGMPVPEQPPESFFKERLDQCILQQLTPIPL